MARHCRRFAAVVVSAALRLVVYNRVTTGRKYPQPGGYRCRDERRCERHHDRFDRRCSDAER